MKNTKIKPRNTLILILAFVLAVIASFSDTEARGNNVDEISSANNYSVDKSDFTLPFNLIDGYIFIDGQVNNKKGKFMFDTATPFAFFVNNHFVPLAKDVFLGQGHAASGQALVLYTQKRTVSVNLTEQIKRDKLTLLPHTNFDFIEKAVLKDFLGMTGHAFNKDYLFIINFDNQTIDFHSFKQDDKTLSAYIDKERMISTLSFTAKDDGRKPEIDLLIGNEKMTGIFDTGNRSGLIITEEMKSRLEKAGNLIVEKNNYLYGINQPYLSCTLRNLTFNNQPLEDIHNVDLKIGDGNELWLGYQFLKHYVSAWDYKNKTITLLKR